MIDFGNQTETVAQIIGDAPAPTGIRSLIPAALPNTPAFPEPGIYFGMPDEVYHAIPALSASGIKKLAASPMLYWAYSSWLSQEARDKEEERRKDPQERIHLTVGKAYHCRLLEGASAFAQRFAIGLDRAQHPDLLESTDEIKGAILKEGHTPLTQVLTGETVDDPKKPGEQKALKRAAKKEDWIGQLIDIKPEAEALIWDRLQAAHRDEHRGKAFISAEDNKRLEIAAAMIERDPSLSKMVTGGQAEVSLFWYCPSTGVPMKARADYLKIKAIVDLKTFGNQRERSIERAIFFEIAGYHYNIQPSVYFEGVEEVRKLVRKHGARAIHSCGDQTIEEQEAHIERMTWALKWASNIAPDEWFWLFQMKGPAPVTRGVQYPRGGTTKMISDEIVSRMKRRFRECSETFGTDPWIDAAPIYPLADEDLPSSATEI